MPPEATEAHMEPQKKRGRPKGSKNGDRASGGHVVLTEYIAEDALNMDNHIVSTKFDVWGDPTVSVKLASEHAQDGLESTIKSHVIIGVSALPNGNASIITNIGMQQPFILVTAEPYESVKDKVFPGVK